MLDWAQTCARLQRYHQFMNGVSNPSTPAQHGTWSQQFLNHIMYAPVWGSQFRFRALCDTFGVLRGYTLSSHAWKSPVNHQNHWCATLRDWTSCSQLHIWITKGRKPVFTDNHFNKSKCDVSNSVHAACQSDAEMMTHSCLSRFWIVWVVTNHCRRSMPYVAMTSSTTQRKQYTIPQFYW